MFSFGQALIDEVTKEVTERVTKDVNFPKTGNSQPEKIIFT